MTTHRVLVATDDVLAWVRAVGLDPERIHMPGSGAVIEVDEAAGRVTVDYVHLDTAGRPVLSGDVLATFRHTVRPNVPLPPFPVSPYAEG